MPWDCAALSTDPRGRQATAMVPRVRRSSACSCSAHLAQGQELPSGCTDTCPSLAPLGINKTPVSGEAATASCSINQTLLNAPWGRAVQAQPSDTRFRRWHRLPGPSPRGFGVILPARHHQCCRTDPCHPTAESPRGSTAGRAGQASHHRPSQDSRVRAEAPFPQAWATSWDRSQPVLGPSWVMHHSLPLLLAGWPTLSAGSRAPSCTWQTRLHQAAKPGVLRAERLTP